MRIGKTGLEFSHFKKSGHKHIKYAYNFRLLNAFQIQSRAERMSIPTIQEYYDWLFLGRGTN